MASGQMNATDLMALCRVVVERSPLALAVTEGAAHRLRCGNSAFSRLTGTAAERLLEHPYAEAFPASRTDGSLALLDRVWRTEEPERITEVERGRPGGGTAFWSYAVWPVLNDERHPAALFVEISDATERVQTRRFEAETAGEIRDINQRLLVAGVREQELAEEAERHSAEMDALLESMSDGVAVVDAEGRIVLMNAAGRKIFHLRPEEDHWAPEDQRGAGLQRLDGKVLPLDQWPIARALRGEQFDQEEVVLARPDGSRRRVVFSGSAIRGDAGHLALAIVVFRDVTALREAEAMKDQLISLVSHDLRTPLNAILGYADLLRIALAEEGREKETRFAVSIVRSVKTMEAMIQDLVESTRLESATPQLHKRRCDLRVLVSDAVQHLVSPEHRTRVEIVSPEPLPPIEADPQRLDRALMNILGNALKYSPPDEPVTVWLERRDGEEVVSVTDRGVGIAAEDLPHVFERFYRAQSGAKTEGFGLGLYITRLVVEAHGGRIWAESEPGVGSTFGFALPIA